MLDQLRKIWSGFQKLPLRVKAIPGALILGLVIWVITELIPGVDRERVELIGAFAIAIAFAFSIGRRRT